MLGSFALAHGRLLAKTNPGLLTSGTASASSAAKWLARYRRKLGARDFDLLRRAQAVLYQDLLSAGPEGRPLPWAPLRGICPAPSRYVGVWNWDGCWHALALSRWDGMLAREQLRIILDRQLPGGALINNIRAQGLVRDRYGQPPIMPWIGVLMDERSPDEAFLRRAYRQFVPFEAHWWRDRGGAADGLFHYSVNAFTGNPREDQQGIRFESGWDNAVRWDESVDLWTVDLNCFMVLCYRALERMAKRFASKPEAALWRAKGEALAARINERLFDRETGAYLDRRRDTGKFSAVLSPASFLPLFIETAGRSQADAMARLAADPRKFFPGMPTVAYDHPSYQSDGYWRGPTWPETTYLAAKGLRYYGRERLAESFRQTVLGWCAANAEELWEYYDSKSGRGLGAPQLACTGAFLIEFILNWEKKDNLKSR